MDSSSKPNTGMAAYRAPSLFQPHLARQALRDAHNGKIPPPIGLFLGLNTVPTARFVAPMGFDFVWVDWEHSYCNVETMTTMVHEIIFASEDKSMPFVRVPGHDHAAIEYALDAGASIIVPQVETVEQARYVVSAAKYGTAHNGTRSAPPFRLISGLTDMPSDPSLTHHENMNEQAAVIIQIETLKGIQNLNAILTQVPDIDGVWLGTLDTRVSMNLPGSTLATGVESECLEAAALFASTMDKQGHIARGSFAIGDDESIKAMAKKKSFLIVAADVVLMGMMAAQIPKVRALVGLNVLPKGVVINGSKE